MNLYFKIKNQEYEVDVSAPISIAIPLNFNGDQPNSYDVDRATSIPYRDGDFVGSVKEGGSCNFEQYTFIPHCNGTHTEGIGHLSLDLIAINTIFNQLLIPSTLISVEVFSPDKTKDTYFPELEKNDKIITKSALEKALKKIDSSKFEALIIRTLPNDASKKSRRYMQELPPFFSKEAMEYIHEIGVQHLLVDIPSVDRTFDDGQMTNHTTFWNTDPQNRAISPENSSKKTITEMIFVPQEVEDGFYLLNLQIPAFVADAAPSRPVLYKYSKRK